MLESNLSAGLDSDAMRIGNEMFPFLFHCRRTKALNSWGEAPTFFPTFFDIEDTARRQTNIFDDEQSDIRGFSHFIASSGELPRTYGVRLVCITNLATSATRGFSFTDFFFCLRALFSTLNSYTLNPNSKIFFDLRRFFNVACNGPNKTC